MRQREIWCLIVGLAAIAGCSRQPTTPCEPDVRYSTARSAPPVQIPDDLSPPNENDALRLPPAAVADGAGTAGECLETPPSFFGESRPFQVSADSQERTESRRSRREARREARGEAAAGQPEAAPTEQRDPEPADDRVIAN